MLYYNNNHIITSLLMLIISTIVAYVSKREFVKQVSANKLNEETYASQICNLTKYTLIISKTITRYFNYNSYLNIIPKN